MMLKARFLRWWHAFSRFHRIFVGEAHQAVTITQGWKTLRVLCDCGKEWK